MLILDLLAAVGNLAAPANPLDVIRQRHTHCVRVMAVPTVAEAGDDFLYGCFVYSRAEPAGLSVGFCAKLIAIGEANSTISIATSNSCQVIGHDVCLEISCKVAKVHPRMGKANNRSVQHIDGTLDSSPVQLCRHSSAYTLVLAAESFRCTPPLRDSPSGFLTGRRES